MYFVEGLVIDMRMYDLIMKKRNGNVLSDEEIDFMVQGYTKGEIPDYQMSAMTMAIFFQGMNEQETLALTMSMAHSGDMLDLSDMKGIKVDKHSTGGVGDKTSLALTPMVAALGVPVAKMSGRGLGHTGGTVDKLESIPGFRTSLETDEFIDIVNSCGLCVAGQSGRLCPADKKLYALRDVTATVDNMPLIASSIMSKKLAAGAKNIVLDVKCGSGAFMKDIESARTLAQKMVDIGRACGRNMSAVISDMDVPLGFAIGNSLEVKEAIALLKGADIPDLRRICLALSAELIAMIREVSVEEAYKIAETALDSGAALAKMKEWISAQGGDVSLIDDTDKFPKASVVYELRCEKDGYIAHMNAELIGRAACDLGAGRKTKADNIDHSAGIVLCKKTGDFVKQGEVLAIFHTSDKVKLEDAKNIFMQSLEFSEENRADNALILDIIR